MLGAILGGQLTKDREEERRDAENQASGTLAQGAVNQGITLNSCLRSADNACLVKKRVQGGFLKITRRKDLTTTTMIMPTTKTTAIT